MFIPWIRLLILGIKCTAHDAVVNPGKLLLADGLGRNRTAYWHTSREQENGGRY
jgi:hypothetical protein